MIFAKHTYVFDNARRVVHAFYFAIFGIIAINSPFDWLWWTQELDPLWPLFWVRSLPPEVATAIIMALAWGGAIAAMVRPEKRWARMACFIGFLLYAAYQSSFGRIKHNYHLWLWASLFLIAFPDGHKPVRSKRSLGIVVVRACQFLPLFFYSLSGIWKILEGFKAWSAGVPGLFSQKAFALIVADFNLIVRPQDRPPVSDFFVEHWPLGSALYWASVALETLCPIVFFFPRYLPAVGLAFIAFHTGVKWIMDLDFLNNVCFLALFLLLLPVEPKLDLAEARQVK